MGKGRNRHRGPRSNPVQTPPPKKNAPKNKQTSHGTPTAAAAVAAETKKNNKNDENSPQKFNSTTLPEKRKTQGDNQQREKCKEKQEQVRDVVKNNNVASESDVNGDVAAEKHSSPTTTTENGASSFIHTEPLNEQEGNDVASNLLFSRENSNEFAPPEKKSKTCDTTATIHQPSDTNDEEAVENLGENRQEISSENCETDEMGQPNSKNGPNSSNGLPKNDSSASLDAAAATSSSQLDIKMGSDDSTSPTERATSPGVKSVRFNDENLCSYADDIFYEANETSLGSTTSLDTLPNNLDNSKSDENVQKVPLEDAEDFDLIEEDDDDITSTYEEAQSISVLVTNDEFYENIVQSPSSKNNVQINNHEENSHDSAFNDDDDVDVDDCEKNNVENLEKTSIYNNNNAENDKINEEDQVKKSTDNKNFSENIHSLNENDEKVKNLYMEDTISLPDIVESSNHPLNGIAEDEKTDEKRDLVNQESRYNVQLEAAAQKVIELKSQINELERDISNKTGVQERLQAELDAANKDSETVRMKLKQQAEELERLRLEADDQTEEWRQKYYDLEKVHAETEEKLKGAQTLATSLQIQIADVRSDTEKCQLEKEKLMDEKTEEQKVLREALDKAIKERNEIEAKWKHDFEQLRNVNSDREERLMEDCEWKMRSMQKQCKEKLENAEKERLAAVQKMTKIEEDCKRHTIELQNVKSYELELSQLRNLTNGQHETIAQYRQQIDELKAEVATVTKKLDEEIENCKDIKKKCELQMIEKEKDAINRIDIARGTIAMQWEDKLLEEMARLKMELEQIGLEEKQEALAKLRKETDEELQALTSTFTAKQEELEQEIASLKEALEKKQQEYVELQAKSDSTMMETRQYLDRAERDSQVALEREIRKRESVIETMKQEHDQEIEQLAQKWETRLERLQEEYQRDISDQTELLKSKHKREMEEQWKQLVAEKEEALQSIESKHKKKIEEAENHISFEEMRMRYERRDPRPEDLRQITELKSIVEAQDRDLRILTERFREIQIFQQHTQNMMHSHSLPPYAQVVAQQQAAQAAQQQQQQSQQQQQPGQPPVQMIPPMRAKSKSRTPVPNGTPLPPVIPPPPISSAMMQMFANPAHVGSPVCEVIYEENEENDQMNGFAAQNGHKKECTPARMNGDSHIPPPVDQKAIVNDIINEVVASAHIQAHGLAESAF
ncbi:repetitive organellar protein-like isoform X2 [Culicoides brevitarsis]|uniref:repetitive organellar protein-like isoform X2 n=1 Tax=Culicoides brevitarsis TaxID=469753 RepID=UPI00307B990F